MSNTRKVSANHSMLGQRSAELLQGAEEHFKKESEQKEEKTDSKKLNDIRNLLFLGRVEETVRIGGFEFTIQTLNSSQLKSIMMKIMKAPSEEQALLIKPYTLAVAVSSINSIPLSEIGEDPFEVISNIQISVIEKLWKKYEELAERVEKDLGEDDLKK
jgi:hypothetical protein